MGKCGTAWFSRIVTSQMILLEQKSHFSVSSYRPRTVSTSAIPQEVQQVQLAFRKPLGWRHKSSPRRLGCWLLPQGTETVTFAIYGNWPNILPSAPTLSISETQPPPPTPDLPLRISPTTIQQFPHKRGHLSESCATAGGGTSVIPLPLLFSRETSLT